MEQILINLIAGALGGVGAGKASPTFDLGTVGNIISGLVGGGILGQIVTLLLPSVVAAAQSGNLSIGGIVSQVIAGGAGGAILTAIIGAIKNKLLPDRFKPGCHVQRARDRVRRQRGKCEGRKSYVEREGGAELVAIARQMHTNPNGRSPSLRAIAAALAARDSSHQAGGTFQPLLSLRCSQQSNCGARRGAEVSHL